MRWTSRAIGSILEHASKPELTRQSERRFAMPDAIAAKDHIYKILELVGTSEKSIEDAVQNALSRASKTIREMKWFEVLETRGHIEKDKVGHYQVTLRVGFTLEE